jgi:hypothetical protein
MVNLTELQGNLNKAELEALKKARKEKKLQKMENLKDLFDKKTLNKIKNLFGTEDQGKTKKDGVISFEELKKQQGKKIKVAEAAKGGMINKYAKGGSVHKNKNKMATTKGWGASRKT